MRQVRDEFLIRLLTVECILQSLSFEKCIPENSSPETSLTIWQKGTYTLAVVLRRLGPVNLLHQRIFVKVQQFTAAATTESRSVA